MKPSQSQFDPYCRSQKHPQEAYLQYGSQHLSAFQIGTQMLFIGLSELQTPQAFMNVCPPGPRMHSGHRTANKRANSLVTFVLSCTSY